MDEAPSRSPTGSSLTWMIHRQWIAQLPERGREPVVRQARLPVAVPRRPRRPALDPGRTRAAVPRARPPGHPGPHRGVPPARPPGARPKWSPTPPATAQERQPAMSSLQPGPGTGTRLPAPGTECHSVMPGSSSVPGCTEPGSDHRSTTGPERNPVAQACPRMVAIPEQLTGDDSLAAIRGWDSSRRSARRRSGGPAGAGRRGRPGW